VAVLRGGRLQQADRPGVVYEQPANSFVAAFLGGPMNFLDGELVQEGNGLVFVTAGWRLRLPARWNRCGVRAVTLGLRAEDVEVSEETPTDGPWWTLEMGVVLVEPMGQGSLVTLEAGAGQLRIQGCQRRREGCKIRVGDKVTVRSRPDRAHLFDRANGDNTLWGQTAESAL